MTNNVAGNFCFECIIHISRLSSILVGMGRGMEILEKVGTGMSCWTGNENEYSSYCPMRCLSPQTASGPTDVCILASWMHQIDADRNLWRSETFSAGTQCMQSCYKYAGPTSRIHLHRRRSRKRFAAVPGEAVQKANSAIYGLRSTAVWRYADNMSCNTKLAGADWLRI